MIKIRPRLLMVVALLSIAAVNTSPQKARKFDIEQWRDVLRIVKGELKSSYYDPTFGGLNVDVRFDLADEKMKNAESLDQLVGIVAQVLLDLNDSHTFFVPPYNLTRVEYGWRIQAVGSDCYVGAVRPGSDAEAKGLQIGDKLLSIDGRPLDRTKVWLADYLYDTLRPQSSMTLVVEKPDKSQQRIIVKAKVDQGSPIVTYHDRLEMDLDAEENDHLTRHRFQELSEDVLIWKMPQFDLGEGSLARTFDRFKKRKALILDLRGNDGGYVSSLENLAGYFFETKLKIADRRGRKELDPIFARSQKEKVFKGRLIVLIDGASKSAAEIFARFIQLEKRGTVIGDRSAGFVMQGRWRPLQVGVMEGLAFGIFATNADVIMSDGKSLEHVGVTPDELLLPMAQDMRLNHDPVMTYAASLVGIKLDPQKAGELFPVQWKSR
ncbi:MAG TPA: S41 family peptidase [Pyrinomonadaceae bacterium]|nr:S41 family peptidase [Pyrinomonadaceae bacterium]